MTLRKRTFWLIGVTLVGLLALLYLVSRLTLQFSALQFVLFGLVCGGAILWLLERTILARLARLSASVSQIGAHSDFSTRVPVEGKDEIAHLAGTINQTLERLEHSRSLLQTTFESTDTGLLSLDPSGHPSHTNPQFFTLWGLPETILDTPGDQWFERLAGQTVNFSRALERFRYWLDHADMQGDEVFELKDGRALECHTRPQRVGGAEGKIIGRIWDCRDITARKAAQATLNQQVGELITVRDIALAGTEATSVEALVELATKIIGANLYPADAFDIALVDEATGALQVYSPHFVQGDIPACILAPGQGVAGRVIATGQTQIVANVAQDPAYAEINPNARSEICVPLKAGQRVIGTLNVESARPTAFGRADENLLTILAGQLTTALEKVRMSAEVQRLAITDGLTGLYNRRYFFTAAQYELERARRYQRPLSAIMLDLDHFKRINDTYGHASGDLVLKAVADYCRKNLRATDLLGRYGGEEFVVLLPETAQDGAQEVAERLCNGIAQLAIDTLHGVLAITASLGIAALDSASPDLDKLLDWADQALYAAKHNGRNRFAVWTGAGAIDKVKPEA
jgi:diguanylate cyclase (GGDEF)-like protein